MIPKIIRLLTILLILIFPLGLVFRIKLSTNILFVPQDIIVLLIFVFCILDAFLNKKLKLSIFYKLQIVFILIGVVSLVINHLIYKDINVMVSLSYVFRYLIYINLINVSKYFKQQKYLKSLFLFSGALFIFLGFVQYYFYNSLAGMRYLGWDNHLYRLFSTFLDPNFSGVFYVFFLFFVFYQVINKKFRDSYLYVLLLFFNFLAIMMTYSRTALVSLTTGIVIYLILKRKFKYILVSILFIITSLFIFSDTLVEGLNPFRTASSQDRLQSLKNVHQIVEKNVLYGVGFNAFRDAQIRYGVRNTVGSSVSNADAGTDNSLLFALAVTGIFGILPFAFSYILLLKEIYITKSTYSLLLFSSLISLIVGSLFLNVLFYTPILSFVLLVISLRKNFS